MVPKLSTSMAATKFPDSISLLTKSTKNDALSGTGAPDTRQVANGALIACTAVATAAVVLASALPTPIAWFSRASMTACPTSWSLSSIPAQVLIRLTKFIVRPHFGECARATAKTWPRTFAWR